VRTRAEAMQARRQPVTPRGETTVGRLVQAASQAFSIRGFHHTSVAEICRLSRVANGTFYQYFADKEQIFLALITDVSERLSAHMLNSLPAQGNALDRILAALHAYLHFVAANTPLHQVFREAEFVRMEVPRRFYGQLAELYIDLLQEGQRRGEIRAFDHETTAFCLIGLQEFIALRYLLWTRQISPEVLKTVEELIRQGMDSGQPRADRQQQIFPDAVFKTLNHASQNLIGVRTEGKRTRERLLAAAEAEFGARGFHKASVADIARRAGVAQGTVYTYFPSKEALFVELVGEINRQLRARIRRAITRLQDRRDIERAGFAAFFAYMEGHPHAYRIVREAEFVGMGESKGQAGRWYYQRLAEGYVRGLRTAIEQGQIRPLPPEPLAWTLMGIGHFLGLRWIVWEAFS